MASRNVNYYLIKTARASGWILFFMLLLYIMTGFALCRKLGFERLMDKQAALAIHQIFDWPLVAVFFVHSVVTIYFALRRWGWIRK